MDIRSFFGTGGVKTKRKSVPPPARPAPTPSSSSKKRKPAASSSSARRGGKKATSSATDPKQQEPVQTSASKKVKRNRVVVDVDDDSDATTDGEMEERSATKKVVHQKKTVDSAKTMDDSAAPTTRKTETKPNPEVSPDAFFAETMKKKPVLTEKERIARALASSSDEEDSKVTMKSAPVGKSNDSDKADSDKEMEVEEISNDKEDTDYEPNEKEESNSESEEELVMKRKSPTKSRQNKRKVMDDDDVEPEADNSVVTASSGIPSPGRRSSSPRRSTRTPVKYAEADENMEEGDSDTVRTATPKSPPKSPPKKAQKPSTPKPSPAKKKKAPSPKKKGKEPPIKPSMMVESLSTDDVNAECLSGLTFVFTGVIPNLHRDSAIEFVKILGGRVTTAVSSKTDYLVIGDVLEDGREVTEGSKYRKATDLGPSKVAILKGEGELYGLTKTIDNRIQKDMPQGETTPVKAETSAASTAAAAAAPIRVNPYAKKPMANPYAKKSSASANPYAKSPTSANPYASKAASSSSASPQGNSAGGGRANINDRNALWADKFAPSSTKNILGNQESVRKLSNWLGKWESTFNNPRAQGKSFGAPGGPWKAALLSGPPGIGKTTTAILVAKESGRDVLEFNASDTRSKKGLSEGLGDVTGSQGLNFGPKSKTASPAMSSKRVIIMDEVDGMGAGDRSGMAELIKMIKASKVPIICICNDRQSQKVRSLVAYCLDLRYRRPVKTMIAKRAIEVGNMEGMKIEMNAAEAIAESCGNDIRQVLNCLQMWSNKKGSSEKSEDLTYKTLKERESFINKDEILRVSMFDATKLIIEGSRGLAGADTKALNDSLYKRSDAFFTDYSLMGLNIHQNYLKVMIPQFQDTKRQHDPDRELDCLERMGLATESMSDFAIAEHAVRTGDQQWGLLPLCAMLAVKTGYHAGGENGGFLPGYPEFAGWLGKNSSRSRKIRLLQELGHHMNYRVSADSTELRLGYVPALRSRFISLMMDKEGAKTDETIGLMDEYGLDRDDLFENLDEFSLDPKAIKFSNALDSKSKAAFTREYNKRAHKSQALVEEQGASKKRKTSPVSTDADERAEAEELDAVNDDKDLTSRDDDGDKDEMDTDDVMAMFKKKGKSSAKGKKKGKK